MNTADKTEQMQEETLAHEAEALRHGPRGALFLAVVAVGALFIGWLLFYFVLFMRRGYVG